MKHSQNPCILELPLLTVTRDSTKKWQQAMLLSAYLGRGDCGAHIAALPLREIHIVVETTKVLFFSLCSIMSSGQKKGKSGEWWSHNVLPLKCYTFSMTRHTVSQCDGNVSSMFIGTCTVLSPTILRQSP